MHDENMSAKQSPLRHEALLYGGAEEYAEGIMSFLRQGQAAGEPTMVALPRKGRAILEDDLKGLGGNLAVFDMEELGSNPSRLIPAFLAFTEAYRGQPVRAVGEPVWKERHPVEVREVALHEALVDSVFADTPGSFLCPYDRSSLPTPVLEDALRNHRHVVDHGARRRSDLYGPEAVLRYSGEPFPPPPAHSERWTCSRSGDLPELRRRLAGRLSAHLAPEQVHDMVAAVNELATNALVHDGGSASVALWCDDTGEVCEVASGGRVADPMAGRRLPATHDSHGRGLWLVNQLCDVVEQRSGPFGTLVRLHLAARDPG